jgi:hypothetical protein
MRCARIDATKAQNEEADKKRQDQLTALKTELQAELDNTRGTRTTTLEFSAPIGAPCRPHARRSVAVADKLAKLLLHGVIRVTGKLQPPVLGLGYHPTANSRAGLAQGQSTRSLRLN